MAQSAQISRCPVCGAQPVLHASLSGKYCSIVCDCRSPLSLVIPNNRIPDGIDAWNKIAGAASQTQIDYEIDDAESQSQPDSGPVALRYRMDGDLQWQYTDREEQALHAHEVQQLILMGSKASKKSLPTFVVVSTKNEAAAGWIARAYEKNLQVSTGMGDAGRQIHTVKDKSGVHVNIIQSANRDRTLFDNGFSKGQLNILNELKECGLIV